MDLLILGGTGFLGRHLVEAALGDGIGPRSSTEGSTSRGCSPRSRRSRATEKETSQPFGGGAGTR
jgi:uncharacterized protein YbjT (DUF2867 family)